MSTTLSIGRTLNDLAGERPSLKSFPVGGPGSGTCGAQMDAQTLGPQLNMTAGSPILNISWPSVTLSVNVTPSASPQTVQVSSLANIQPYLLSNVGYQSGYLGIGSSTTQEKVQCTAVSTVSGNHFITAVFAQSHSSGDLVVPWVFSPNDVGFTDSNGFIHPSKFFAVAGAGPNTNSEWWVISSQPTANSTSSWASVGTIDTNNCTKININCYCEGLNATPPAAIQWQILASNDVTFATGVSTFYGPVTLQPYAAANVNSSRDAVFLGPTSITGTAYPARYLRLQIQDAVAGSHALFRGQFVTFGYVYEDQAVSFIDTSNITLASNATNTVASARGYFGTDDGLAWQAFSQAVHQTDDAAGSILGTKGQIPSGISLSRIPQQFTRTWTDGSHGGTALMFGANTTPFSITTQFGQLVKPLVLLGTTASTGGRFPNFFTKLSDLQILCNDVVGASGVYTESIQEPGINIEGLSIFSWNQYGLMISTGNCQNWSAQNLWLLASQNCAAIAPVSVTAAITPSASPQTVSVLRTDHMTVGVPYVFGCFTSHAEIVSPTSLGTGTVTGIFLAPHAVGESVFPDGDVAGVNIDGALSRCRLNSVTIDCTPGIQQGVGCGIRVDGKNGITMTIDDVHTENCLHGIFMLNGAACSLRSHYGYRSNATVVSAMPGTPFAVEALYGNNPSSPWAVWDGSRPTGPLANAGSYSVWNQQQFWDVINNLFMDFCESQLRVNRSQVLIATRGFGDGSGGNFPTSLMGNSISLGRFAEAQEGTSGYLYSILSSNTSVNPTSPGLTGTDRPLRIDSKALAVILGGLLGFADATTGLFDSGGLPLGPLNIGHQQSTCWHRLSQTGTSGRVMQIEQSSNSGVSFTASMLLDAITGIATFRDVASSGFSGGSAGQLLKLFTASGTLVARPATTADILAALGASGAVTGTFATGKITTGGTAGSITVTNGLITAATNAT